MQAIDQLHALVFEDGLRGGGRGASLKFRIRRDGLPGVLDQELPGELTVTAERSLTFLGEEIRVGAVSIVMSSMSLKQDKEELRKAYEEGSKGEFDIEYVGTADNTITQKLIRPPPS